MYPRKGTSREENPTDNGAELSLDLTKNKNLKKTFLQGCSLFKETSCAFELDFILVAVLYSILV